MKDPSIDVRVWAIKKMNEQHYLEFFKHLYFINFHALLCKGHLSTESISLFILFFLFLATSMKQLKEKKVNSQNLKKNEWKDCLPKQLKGFVF